MDYIPAKSLLSTTRDGNSWFGMNYNMNLYKGCSHGCIYCDSRSECYGIEDFDRVRAKENALVLLEKELSSKRKSGVIALGGMSDSYNPFEKELDLTGRSLDLIDKYRFGAAVATKSSLITRDIPRYKRIFRHSPVILKITVTAATDDLSRLVEPRVSPTSERFDALKEISHAGIFAGILLMPLLPFIEDNEDNVLSIVEQAHKAGARFIYPGFGVTLRLNQRQWYYERLDESFPGLKERYIRAFGDQYGCSLPGANRLAALFKKECRKRGILYNMSDIVSTYHKAHGGQQLSLF